MGNLLPFTMPFIRFAETVHWPVNFKWGPRRLYDHELFYVVSGLVEVELGDRSFKAGNDHLLFIPPRIQQTFCATSRSDNAIIGIHFDWEKRPDSPGLGILRPHDEPSDESWFREKRMIPLWDSDTSPLLDLRRRPRVRRLFDEVIAAFSIKGDLAQQQAGALLAAAMAQIAHEANLQADLVANPQVGADAVRRVHRARELLEETRRETISVAEVAASVGWSPDHLGKMCREVAGISPYRIQTRARLQRARQLLRYGNMSAAEIAMRCGFKDVNHFRSLFKREVGMTTREYAETAAEV